MISYAQNYEDVMLARVFGDRTAGFYIDVGAMDPVTHSVTRHFYDLGWRGINVEPVPRYFARLVELRPEDINLNFALGEAESEQDFFSVPDTGLSTFRGDLLVAVPGGPSALALPKMRVTTLAALCAEHVGDRTIDFLKIDVEGWEAKVIAGADWRRFRPRVVLAEATRPNSPEPAWDDWEPMILAAGYRFVWFDGLNRYYVRDEDADLARHFMVPPNVFDNFETWESAHLRQERDIVAAEHARLSVAHLSLIEEHRRLAAERDHLSATHLSLVEEHKQLAASHDQVLASIDALRRSRVGGLAELLFRMAGCRL